MRLPHTQCLALVLLASAASSVPARAAGTHSDAAPSEAHVTAPAVDYTLPGPEHAKLAAALTGRWTSTYHVTPAPGAKPMDIPGTAEFRPILGGAWIEGQTDLVMGETRIAGRALYGFDRFKQKYVFLFVQAHDTQPLFGYGTADAAGTRITFTVPMDIPMLNLQGVPMRTVLDVSKAGAIVFEMNQALPDGKEFQPLRIDYGRAK